MLRFLHHETKATLKVIWFHFYNYLPSGFQNIMKLNIIASIALGAIVSATVSLPAAVRAEQSSSTLESKATTVNLGEDAKPDAQNKGCRWIPGLGWRC
ncbi:MAG: hypothetical protein AAFV72_16800 [Cyanobacteria bacterium J06635_1]